MARTDTNNMITDPALIQIDMLNGTKITGRFVKYTDPVEIGYATAWVGVDRDGGTTYVNWSAVLRLNSFPLINDIPASETEVTQEVKNGS